MKKKRAKQLRQVKKLLSEWSVEIQTHNRAQVNTQNEWLLRLENRLSSAEKLLNYNLAKGSGKVEIPSTTKFRAVIQDEGRGGIWVSADELLARALKLKETL